MKKRLKTEATQMKGGNKTMKKNDKAGNRSHFPTFPLSHLLLSMVITLALCLVGASGAWALGLSLTGNPAWSLTNISPESVNESITWTVTNTDGAVAEDISISVANSTNWQAATDTTISNKFVLDHNGYGTEPWTNITSAGVALKDNLPAEGTKNFKLQFTAPKSYSKPRNYRTT